MVIRYATKEDLLSAVRSLQKNQTFYNTTSHLKEDIEKNRLIIIEENGKLLGSCALVYEENWDYLAIKRLNVYAKKSRGKGYADKLIKYVISLNLGTLGSTPWKENMVARHLFEKNGFTLQYDFMDNYCFYKR